MTPGTDQSYVEIHIIEGHNFYDKVGAIAAGFTPRELTIFADVHKKHDKRSFLARDGRFFVEHLKSTDDLDWNNQERRVKIHDLSIICDGDVFILDRTPFNDVYLEQSMDFFAELQKFHDEEQKPLRYPPIAYVAPEGSGPFDYWSGLCKELPQGASVTQVLYASLHRIGYFMGGSWRHGMLRRPWHHFNFH